MKQLSSSELNHMSKEEMAAMILQMQQLQKQMEQQIHTLMFGSGEKRHSQVGEK